MKKRYIILPIIALILGAGVFSNKSQSVTANHSHIHHYYRYNRIKHHKHSKLRLRTKKHRNIYHKIDKQQDDDISSALLYKQEKKFAKQRRKYHYPEVERNTRDLGGYKTLNHKYIKPDKIIRSNNLHNLNHNGKNKLRRLHVNEILDLRDAKQIQNEPDPGEKIPFQDVKANNKVHLHIPIKQDDIYNHKGLTQMGKNNMQYRYATLLATNPTAIHGYRVAFQQLLKHKHGAILYHCIEGRDRTGILSALVLSSLNVKRSTIYKDYLLTDYYSHKRPMIKQYNQLHTFFKVVDSRYGSVKNYLHVIGISGHDFHLLRQKYLIKR